eukprot:TRINITY_DN25631_c0_g1_i1.p2 TRINITY_DN25631_c0_g1~~TRINITY_DN25631_c0_g1_i1.p2  ORF type:complete len:130 (+),score=21.99 TRINITY_DN25631_c0_g1_i1:73-462(+)
MTQSGSDSLPGNHHRNSMSEDLLGRLWEWCVDLPEAPVPLKDHAESDLIPAALNSLLAANAAEQAKPSEADLKRIEVDPPRTYQSPLESIMGQFSAVQKTPLADPKRKREQAEEPVKRQRIDGGGAAAT